MTTSGPDLNGRRPVYVAGVGLHRYQSLSDTSYVDLGLTAVRAALADGGLTWPMVERAYIGTARLGMAPARPMLRYLGTTTIPTAQVENASASGSSAFRLCWADVANELADVACAVGIDKPLPVAHPEELVGVEDLTAGRLTPAVRYALLAEEYQDTYGATREDVARVAVKNHQNGALNPFAHRQQARSIGEVLGDRPVAGQLTRLECCPIGEGGAAAIVVSDRAIDRLGLDRRRCVQVRSSVHIGDEIAWQHSVDACLTAATTAAALQAADIGPEDLDVIELHDAFAIEELMYVEAMGLCQTGEAAACLERGDFAIGGRCAVNPSGGLLAMGHPIGPTGVGQIAEITSQLRGEAGPRQQPGARNGLAHMVGLGGVCVEHVLQTTG